MLNLSNYDAALKEFYEDGAKSTLNNEVVAFKELDETDREWSGRRVVWMYKTSRNNGVGARAEGGSLPDAGQQGTSNVYVSAAYLYGRIKLSGQTLAAGKNAFVDAMTLEMDGLVEDLIQDCSRQAWGMGDGRMAQVGAAAGSASTITLYNKYFEPGQPGAKYLDIGMSIDIGTVAAPTQNCSSQVLSLVGESQNPATTVDTIGVTASSLNGSQCESYLFNRGAGGAGLEMMGICGLVDEYTAGNIWGSNAFAGATVQGLSRVTIPNWNSTVLGNSGVARIVDGLLMQTAMDKINVKSGKEADTIWAHHDVVRAFLESVAADRRYTSPDFDAGYKTLSYNGIKLIRDRHAHYNQALVFVRDCIKLFTLSDWKWADDDGRVLNKVSGLDQYEAYYRGYKNIGFNDFPKKALMIRDITTEF